MIQKKKVNQWFVLSAVCDGRFSRLSSRCFPEVCSWIRATIHHKGFFGESGGERRKQRLRLMNQTLLKQHTLLRMLLACKLSVHQWLEQSADRRQLFQEKAFRHVKVILLLQLVSSLLFSSHLIWQIGYCLTGICFYVVSWKCIM